MNEIEYNVSQVYIEHDRYVICSDTAWLGNMHLSKDVFNSIGRPTAGDKLLLTLRSCKENPIYKENINKDDSQ